MNTVIRKNRDWVILFIFLAALSARVLYILQIRNFPLTEYLTNSSTFDMNIFDKQAKYIASGNWTGAEAVFYIEPLYPYFLALIYRVIGYGHINVYIIQAILSSIGAMILYKTVGQLLNRAGGIIAALIFSFYPMSIYYDAFLLRESLNVFLFILLFYLTLKASVSRRGPAWFVAGMAMGLSMLMRQNILLPFILFFILFTIKPFRKATLCAAIFLSAFFIVISPAVIKNYLASGHKIIEISRGKGAFWVGNTYNASGTELDWTREYYDLETRSEGSLKKIINLFIDEIKKRPREYARLYLRKAWMFFNGYEVPSNTNLYLYMEEFPTILKSLFLNFRFICAFGILGALITLFEKQKPYLAYIFITVLSLSVILFNIQARYRFATVPFFIMFSSFYIYAIFDKLRHRYYQRSLLLIGILIFIYIILKPDLTYAGFRKKGEWIRPYDRTNLALAYLDAYKRNARDIALLSMALSQCNKALKAERRDSVTYRIKGYIFLLGKDYNASIREYKNAITYRNRQSFLYSELGGVYYEANDYKRAFIYISRALHLFPENEIFKRNLSLLKNENHQ